MVTLREILAMPWMGDAMLDFIVLAIQGMKIGLEKDEKGCNP